MKEKRPITLIVMDGVGLNSNGYGNAVKAAFTPVLDNLTNNYPNIAIKAHGLAVGLPSDEDMGNSEVGHNAMGCGQIYAQGAKLVNESIENGKMYTTHAWNTIVDNCIENKSVLHFIGLLSDGNVHSNIAHLKSMLRVSKVRGLSKVRIHILLDGRDVEATSALRYVEDLENLLMDLNCTDFDGRMKITMDRYEANWDMVKLGWETQVLGIGRQFASAILAIETYRNELSVIDQDLPPFVIAENGIPIGAINDQDSVKCDPV